MTASAAPQSDAIAASAPAPGRPWKTIAFAAVALVAGVGVGTVVVAPRLRGGNGAAQHAAPATTPKAESGPPRMIKLDNLIVNPAGTQGAHFLIVSVGIEVRSAVTETRLHEAEIPLRDAVTDMLGQMSMERLSQPGVRDAIRRQLAVLAIKFAQDSSVQVYLPQFLIQ